MSIHAEKMVVKQRSVFGERITMDSSPLIQLVYFGQVDIIFYGKKSFRLKEDCRI